MMFHFSFQKRFSALWITLSEDAFFYKPHQNSVQKSRGEVSEQKGRRHLCCAMVCMIVIPIPTGGKRTPLLKLHLSMTATLNYLAQLPLWSLLPLFLWADVSVFWGCHWTEAWHGIGAGRLSQFGEVSQVSASTTDELCWSLEELWAFAWSLYKPGDFAQRGRFDVKLAELFPATVRTSGCLSGTAGAYTAFCSDRWSPHWLRCSARTRGCWSSPSSEITKTGLFVSAISSFVFESLTKLIFSGLEGSRGFWGLWLLPGDAAPRCLEGSKDFTCLPSGELAKNPK